MRIAIGGMQKNEMEQEIFKMLPRCTDYYY